MALLETAEREAIASQFAQFQSGNREPTLATKAEILTLIGELDSWIDTNVGGCWSSLTENDLTLAQQMCLFCRINLLRRQKEAQGG